MSDHFVNDRSTTNPTASNVRYIKRIDYILLGSAKTRIRISTNSRKTSKRCSKNRRREQQRMRSGDDSNNGRYVFVRATALRPRKCLSARPTTIAIFDVLTVGSVQLILCSVVSEKMAIKMKKAIRFASDVLTTDAKDQEMHFPAHSPAITPNSRWATSWVDSMSHTTRHTD